MDVLGYLDIPALLSDLSCPPSVTGWAYILDSNNTFGSAWTWPVAWALYFFLLN